jgi:hypothetical protein
MMSDSRQSDGRQTASGQTTVAMGLSRLRSMAERVDTQPAAAAAVGAPIISRDAATPSAKRFAGPSTRPFTPDPVLHHVLLRDVLGVLDLNADAFQDALLGSTSEEESLFTRPAISGCLNGTQPIPPAVWTWAQRRIAEAVRAGGAAPEPGATLPDLVHVLIERSGDWGQEKEVQKAIGRLKANGVHLSDDSEPGSVISQIVDAQNARADLLDDVTHTSDDARRFRDLLAANGRLTLDDLTSNRVQGERWMALAIGLLRATAIVAAAYESTAECIEEVRRTNLRPVSLRWIGTCCDQIGDQAAPLKVTIKACLRAYDTREDYENVATRYDTDEFRGAMLFVTHLLPWGLPTRFAALPHVMRAVIDGVVERQPRLWLPY